MMIRHLPKVQTIASEDPIWRSSPSLLEAISRSYQQCPPSCKPALCYAKVSQKGTG